MESLSEKKRKKIQQAREVDEDKDDSHFLTMNVGIGLAMGINDGDHNIAESAIDNSPSFDSGGGDFGGAGDGSDF